MKDKELRVIVGEQGYMITKAIENNLFRDRKIKELLERIKLLEDELGLEFIDKTVSPKYIRKDKG